MKHKTKMILKVLLLIFLLLFGSSLPLVVFNVDITKYSKTVRILYSLLCDLIFLIVVLLIYRRTIIKDGGKFFKNFWNNIETAFKYWLVGVTVMAIGNIVITFITNGGMAENEQQVRELIDLAPLFMIFDVSIYAPFTEELIFRKGFRDAINNKWVYIITSGFVFGALHVISSITTPVDLLYLIPYCSLGITFAYTYYKTNNIFSTISMHMMHNTMAVAIYLLGSGL